MPLQILELGKQFRPGTSHVYPPFKNGLYMEEYVYNYLTTRKETIKTTHVYLPVFWTNLQNHPAFATIKDKYQLLLDNTLKTMPIDTTYFTIVQHDDGPQLVLPKGTIVLGACTGTIPLPLIYQDSTNTLFNSPRLEKVLLASFVGTSTTHPIRKEMISYLLSDDIVCYGRDKWASSIPDNDASMFINLTLRSKFCLAPRGYGRSSFRFFEAMQLDVIPVYIWDDVEWLPYKDQLDYTSFSISIHRKDLPDIDNILRSISDETYQNMVRCLTYVRHYFTLEGMCEYIVQRMTTHM